jgi:hypothetical protein
MTRHTEYSQALVEAVADIGSDAYHENCTTQGARVASGPGEGGNMTTEHDAAFEAALQTVSQDEVFKALHALIRAAENEEGTEDPFYEALNAVRRFSRAIWDARGEADARACRCFHCDEVFTTTEAAELHFGRSEFDKPACQTLTTKIARLKAINAELLAALEAVNKEWSEFWPLGPDIPRSSERVAAIAPKTADIWRGIRSAIARAKGQS